MIQSLKMPEISHETVIFTVIFTMFHLFSPGFQMFSAVFAMFLDLESFQRAQPQGSRVRLQQERCGVVGGHVMAAQTHTVHVVPDPQRQLEELRALRHSRAFDRQQIYCTSCTYYSLFVVTR